MPYSTRPRSTPGDLLLFLLLITLMRCSDNGTSGVPPNPDGGGTITEGGIADSSVPQIDTGPEPQACDCPDNQICDTEGQCIPEPQPASNQGFAEIVLLRQQRPGDSSIMGHVGKAEADFDIWEPLPQDTRPHYTTWDGGDCAYEMGTLYPYDYNGQSWPSGPGLGVGKVTFRPQGAPAPGIIELDPLDMDPGWAYFHDEVPPALTEGAGTFRDFFEPAHIPYDVPFSVELQGGPDIGPTTISGGHTAADFKIVEPAAEGPNATAKNNAPLTIKWAPAQPGATMEIFIEQSFGLLTCTVRDDGETTIPAPALNTYLGEASLQLRRNVVRYSQIQTLQGQPMHVYLIGRHARLGSVTFQN